MRKEVLGELLDITLSGDTLTLRRWRGDGWSQVEMNRVEATRLKEWLEGNLGDGK